MNAGHPPAFVVRADGTVEALGATRPPVGLLDLPGVTFEPGIVELPPGAALVVYSDGITEVQRGSEQFGDARFGAVLREIAASSAADIARRIETEVDAWVGEAGLPDDFTLLVVRRTPVS